MFSQFCLHFLSLCHFQSVLPSLFVTLSLSVSGWLLPLLALTLTLTLRLTLTPGGVRGQDTTELTTATEAYSQNTTDFSLDSEVYGQNASANFSLSPNASTFSQTPEDLQRNAYNFRLSAGQDQTLLADSKAKDKLQVDVTWGQAGVSVLGSVNGGLPFPPRWSTPAVTNASEGTANFTLSTKRWPEGR